MISKDSIFPVGKIARPHGIHGEMSFTFTTDVFDSEACEYFIIEKEGIPVPFFIESYRFKSDSTALLKLQDVKTADEAKDFSGDVLYLPVTFREEKEVGEDDPDYYVGFELIEENAGSLGIVSEIDRTTENVLFVIEKEEDELLIPAGEDYVIDVDHTSKKITLRLPEGLLDL
jgi:16S rRNA processing protein RimM